MIIVVVVTIEPYTGCCAFAVFAFVAAAKGYHSYLDHELSWELLSWKCGLWGRCDDTWRFCRPWVVDAVPMCSIHDYRQQSLSCLCLSCL